MLGVALGVDGQRAVGHVDVNIFLLEAGEIRFQHKGVLRLPDIGADGAVPAVSKEFPLHLLHHAEGVVISGDIVVSAIRNERHDCYLQSYDT